MGVIAEIQAVFGFLGEFYQCLPVMLKLLITASFGGILYIAFLKSIKR